MAPPPVFAFSRGCAKLARFSALKSSTRNCTLKLSDILGMRLFLTMEKSTSAKPGPRIEFRARLPRMFGQKPGKPIDAARAVSQYGVFVAVWGTMEKHAALR